MLTPEDYGITALPAVFMAVARMFINGSFNGAMVRKPDLTEKDISTAFIYSTVVGVVCYLLLFFGAPWIADFYNEEVLTPLIRVTALTFLWLPMMTPQNIILQRKLDFKTPARIAIITNIVGAIVGISMAYLGYGIWSLVVMGVVSSLLSLILTWVVVRWVPRTGWSKDSFRYLWGFGNKLLASGLLDTLYNNITPIIVGKFYSTADLGVYNRANNYAALPAQQGTSVIQQVTFPVLSKMQNDDDMLAHGYRKMLKVSAFVIFPIMTLLAALARPFIIILVTEKWEASIILLQLICFSMMWWPIHAINLNLLQVKGRTDLFFRLEIWKKALGLTIMVCTLPFGLIYFVAAGIVSSLICLFINTYYTGKLINVGFMKQMQDLLPTYGLSLLIFIFVFLMNLFIDNLWVQLILGGAVGICLYIGLAVLFKFKEIEDVKYMLNRRK